MKKSNRTYTAFSSTKVLGLLLGFLSLISLSIGTASAGSYFLVHSCSGACPLASSIFVNTNLNKSAYASNEAVTLFADVSSDDNPQGTNPNPIVIAHTPGYAMSPDLFPGTYTKQDLRDGLTATAFIGNAPAAAGSYIVNETVGSAGYSSKSGTIPFTVVAPVPTVNLYFSFSDVIGSLFEKLFASS